MEETQISRIQKELEKISEKIDRIMENVETTVTDPNGEAETENRSEKDN